MKNKDKTLHEHTNTVISEHGEVLEVLNKKTHAVGAEPPFFKIYCDFIDDLSNLFGLGHAEKAVFLAISRNMSYSNVIFIVKPTKEILMKETGIKAMNTLNKAIDGLFKKGFLIRKGRGVYVVNPNYAGKGRWEEIKALRIVIDYGKKGRNVNVEKINTKVIEVSEITEKTEEQKKLEAFEKRQTTIPFDDV